MSLQNDLNQLLANQVITEDTALAIERYYQSKSQGNNNSITTIFAIIGSVLVGLGIMLILAHNWDQIDKWLKVSIAFFPLILAQGLGWYTLKSKAGSTGWREGCAVFLALTAGACISLLSQIFNIEGSLQSFLWIWIILSLGIVYLFEARLVSLLIIFAATIFIGKVGNKYDPQLAGNIYWYWLFMAALVPFYYSLLKNQGEELGTVVHNWFFPVGLTIGMASTNRGSYEIMYLLYFILMGIWYLLGHRRSLPQDSLMRNGYKVIGSFGSIGILLVSSFRSFWDMIYLHDGSAPLFEGYVLLLLAICWVFLCIDAYSKRIIKGIKPLVPLVILYGLVFFLPISADIKTIIINALTFIFGIMTIRQAIQEDHLGILNYGLLIIALLIICRFFDTDIAFIWRGLIFIGLGICFFVINYLMIKKRKSESSPISTEER